MPFKCDVCEDTGFFVLDGHVVECLHQQVIMQSDDEIINEMFNEAIECIHACRLEGQEKIEYLEAFAKDCSEELNETSLAKLVELLDRLKG